MTIDTNYSDIMRLLALIIENAAEDDTDGHDPKQLAKDYIENVLDNGWDNRIPSIDEAKVWGLFELMGYEPDTMDEFEAFAKVVKLIDECDLFNG